MRFRQRALVLLLLLSLMVVCSLRDVEASQNSGGTTLRLMSILYEKEWPAHETASVEVTVAHKLSVAPEVLVYYTWFSEDVGFAGNWMISNGKGGWSGSGFTIYEVKIPNPVYQETMPYESTVVFYVEVRDLAGESVLSCDEADRWNPYSLEGKYVFYTVDADPPRIESALLAPSEPKTSDIVSIYLEIVDEDSGVSEVQLTYVAQGQEHGVLLELYGRTEHTYHYKGQIGPFEVAEPINYYVVVSDEAGNRFEKHYSFTLLPATEELPNWILPLFSLVFLAILGLVLFYVLRRKTTGGYVPEKTKHPRIMTVMLLIVLGFAAAFYLQLSKLNTPALGVLYAFFMVGLYGLMDRRVNVGLPFKLSVDENPPTILIFEALATMLLSVVVFIAYLASGLISLQEVSIFATSLGGYIIAMLTLGFLLQVGWLHLKDVTLNVEVERS